jgi:hypothetical protein
MCFEVRIFVCGFVCLAAATAGEPEPMPLPAIFAEPAKAETFFPESKNRLSLVSDRVHRLITSAVMANESYSLKAAVFRLADRAEENPPSDAVLMDKVVVRSSAFPKFDLPEPVSSLDKFRKHGILYESVGKKFTFDTMFYVDRWYSNRQGSGGIETRAELKFNLRW